MRQAEALSNAETATYDQSNAETATYDHRDT